MVSAGLAWLTAGSMVLEHAFGRTIIALVKWSKAANVPRRAATRPISYPAGMPGGPASRTGTCWPRRMPGWDQHSFYRVAM